MGTEPKARAGVPSLVHRTVFTPIREGSAVAETVARHMDELSEYWDINVGNAVEWGEDAAPSRT